MSEASRAKPGDVVAVTQDGTPVTVTVRRLVAAARGMQGASAYEVAVAEGFVGDETVWLASLQGAAGATGQQGIQGQAGAPGEVPAARTISTTAPLTGGGDLSANRTLAVSDATTTAKGVVELATSGENAANVVVQGNDARLSDARTPTAHSHGAADLPDASTTAKGIVELATSAEVTAGLAVQASDTRLSDARTPTAHKASHEPGGSDPMAVDAAAGVGSLRTLGTGATQAAAGDHTHAGGSDPFATLAVALASDVSTGANTTPVNVTGLVFNFLANSKYIIEVFGVGQSAAATTGWGIQLDVSAVVTLVTMQFVHQLANTGTLSGGSSIADDASVGVSSGIPSAATNVPFYASGILVTGANTGTAQLRWRSEVAAVSTVKAGTMMRVHKVA